MQTHQLFEPTWNSLKEHLTPQWFLNAKFGIYTHWGVYSVPACGPNGTWYPYNMYREGTEQYAHHLKKYGGPEKFGYKDFIPMFTAEKFDPEEWADLFKKSGAQFAGPVGEHHDGFSMWNSKLTEWNAAKMGSKRDIVGELEKAIRAQGMRFLVAMHHAENWWFYPHWRKEFDTSDPRCVGLYGPLHEVDGNRPEQFRSEDNPFFTQEKPSQEFLELWKGKLQEIIDFYQPDLIWFDFGLGHVQDNYRREAIAYYYNKEQEWNKKVLVTHKVMPNGWYHLPPGVGMIDLEVGKMNELTPYPWLTDTSVDAGPGGTWSYVENVGYKSIERLIHNLIDRVSKNGHLLLNVGPRPDGTIPEPAKECLLGIGKWLAVNGEAIFDTTPWQISGEGPTKLEGGGHFNENNEARFTSHDFRFTVKDNTLYAICMGQPGDQVTIKSLNTFYSTEIQRITLLGVKQDLRWRLDEGGLTINIPERMPFDHAFSFKIERHHPFD